MSTGVTDLQREVAAALATPHRIVSLAASFRITHSTMQARVKRCMSAGLVVRVGYGRYAAVAATALAELGAVAFKRSQPLRDAILAFLTQERQAKEIADHIGRPVPNATGHLAAMGRCGLVVRTAYGRYQRTDLMLDGSWPAKIVRPAPMKTELRPGTTIATFDANGRYANLRDGSSHAAIYLGQNAEGIQVLDQWAGSPAAYRTIRWSSATGAASNTGSRFYVVTRAS